MQHSPATTPKPKVASPKGVARIGEGKVKKPKASYKSEIPAIQHINGKTYACESCKRGHRVHKCDHGRTRPISETNQPGRPSAGQKRGCNCPRNCACTTKSCKCDRDCACTQEMFLVVRLDNPVATNRESTSTPKPVWEDPDGIQLTLKKVWADANGKEINDYEYEARQRLKKDREESAKDAPASSCCGSQKPKDEPDSSKGGCRHRQNVAAIQPYPPAPKPTPHLPATEPWMSTCSCGTGCSCLYCPDHPNNTTSINHAQQQVKAGLAYVVGPNLTSVPLNADTASRSCMGGQPSFLLSTSGVSQHQLQQFFSDTLNSNAIYLTYPVQRHSWSNSPLSSHCSNVQSPSDATTLSHDNPQSITGHLSELATPMPLPSDNMVWDFSGNQLGTSSFSWMDLDASYGTDYNIGQATVASTSNSAPFQMLQPPITQQVPSITTGLETTSTVSLSEYVPLDSVAALDENSFVDFDVPFPPGDVESSLFNPTPVPILNARPAGGCCPTPWVDFDLLNDPHMDPDFHPGGLPTANSPIINDVR